MPHRPPHPKPPTAPSPQPIALTGQALTRRLAPTAHLYIGQSGDACCYVWRLRTIILSPEVARGTDVGSLIAAAEEAAHHAQPRWMHWLRFLLPVRWLAEADAFLRVKRTFSLKC